MLPRPDLNKPFRVVGIDPGTESLGFAVLDLSLSNRKVTVRHVETLKSQDVQKNYSLELELHGARTARLMGMHDRLVVLLEVFQPHAVSTESPYMGRFPQAFAALTECVSYVRRAVDRYDRYQSLESVDPPTAKKAVGMTVKRGSTKDDVKQAVAKLDIEYAEGINLDDLDEHSVDAIAVAYHQVQILLDQIPTD